MRAAENRRWLLRATNDGITATIDPAGRITQRLPMYQESMARMNTATNRAPTFYTEHGDWFAWGCWLGAAVALFCSQFPHYTRPSKAPAQTRYPCRITSTSPSLTMYSLPSRRSSPFSRTPG